MTNYNPNKVKINRSYSYEELAAVYGVHKNTVAAWVNNGLPCLKDMRPYLILGTDAKQYLQARRKAKKQKCNLNEFYCVRCKQPSQIANNLVKYLPLTVSKGRLNGICSTCGREVNKFISYVSLGKYLRIFDLANLTALEHINDSENTV